MLNKEKIENLTEILDPKSLEEEVNCGVVAYENDKYSQAYNHLYKAFKAPNCKRETKAKAEFYLAEILRKLSADETVKMFENNNEELANLKKTKPNASNYEKASHLYKKYLGDAALAGNSDAMMEYGLNCIRLGSEGAYLFDATDSNREAAIAWAKVLLTKQIHRAKVIANVIYAKYYLYQSTKFASSFNIESFCENTIKAYNLDKMDPRACYFMGIMCGDQRIKNTKYADYYNINSSYNYFVNADKYNYNKYRDKAVDEGTSKYIALYEKSFPNIKR